MVNLIITLISIALIAAVAVAALYNGGDAFRQGSAKSSAAQLVNAGQQISAANVLYANDNGGSYTTDLTELNDGSYLSSTPRIPDGFATPTLEAGNIISITDANGADEICQAVNVQAGEGDVILSGTDSDAVTGAFGCYGTAGTSATFVFK